jgi:UDP:flavonoid glycosyltransferase YjiC (YdhE family)
MRVAIITYGTRGDVQPYVVLGHALAARGHAVRVAVCQNLVGMVDAAGLGSVPIPFDTQEFMSSPEGRTFLSTGKMTRFLKEAVRRETGCRDAIGEAFIETCDDADVIISNALTITRARSLGDANGVPVLPVYTVPIEPTGEFACPYLIRSTAAPTRALRRGSHVAFETVYWQGSRANDAAFRRQLGLPGRHGNALRALRRDRVPVHHLVTRELLPEPTDWPSYLHNVGAVDVPASLREAWGETHTDPALAAWLDAGEPPVFFGYGSMPVLDPAAALAMISEVARRLGVRALVGAGWSDLANATTDDVYVATTFDHDEVLPRCAAAVHHGGAGTTQTVIRAGIPAVVAHVFADQPMWGMLVARQGLGTHAAYQSLTTDRLVSLLQPLLAPDVRRRTAAAAHRMTDENAVGTVVSLVERAVPPASN